MIAALGVSGLLAWRETDRSVLALQLRDSDRSLEGNVRVARALFDARFPGPWRLVAATPADSAVTLYNGNGRVDSYRVAERLPSHLYKGETKLLANPAVEAVLLEIDSLTGVELTISQRIPPRHSADATVGDAPDGRALRLATTVTRKGADGVARRATLTVQPTRNVTTGAPVGAGAVFRASSTFAGRATVAGQDSWTRYEPIAGPDGSVIGIFYGGTPFEQFTDASARIARQVAVAGVLSLAVATLVLILLMRRLLKPIGDIRAAALRLAAGDLTTRAGVTARDEIGDLGRAFDSMAADVQSLVGRIAGAAGRLTGTAGHVDAAVATASTATQQVAQSAAEVAGGAAETATRLQEVTQEAAAAAGQVGAIRTQSERAVAEASAADAAVADGHAEAARTLAVSDGVRSVAGKAAVVIAELDAHSDQIGSILEALKRVAEQTHLLGLNAAIESARAGSSGSGFAVVASEVRQLAQETREAAEGAETLIEMTRRRTAAAVALIADVEREAAAGEVASRASDAAFRRVGGAVERLTAQVAEMRAAADAADQAVRRVTDAAGSVAAIAQQSAAASEELSASAEEQSGALQEITAQTHSLSRMADDLRGAIGEKAAA